MNGEAGLFIDDADAIKLLSIPPSNRPTHFSSALYGTRYTLLVLSWFGASLARTDSKSLLSKTVVRPNLKLRLYWIFEELANCHITVFSWVLACCYTNGSTETSSRISQTCPHDRASQTPVPLAHYHRKCPLCRAILIPQRPCTPTPGLLYLFDTTSLTSITFMKVHPSPRYLFLPRIATQLRLPKLPLEHARSIPLTTSAQLPSRTSRSAPISEASAVSGTKSAIIRVAPCRSVLSLWRRDPLDLPLAYSVLDAVSRGERGRRRKLGFTLMTW